MDDPRVGRLEELVRGLQHEMGVLRTERQRSRQRAQEGERLADEALLRGGSTFLPGPEFVQPSAKQMGRPDLAGPLAARLKENGGTDDAVSGNLYSTNMLKDPLFETLLGGGSVTVGTSWTALGDGTPLWEARKVAVSGASPTVTARQTERRKLMEGHIYRSDIIVFEIDYAGTGEAQVELRPTTPAAAPVHIAWPWCAAAARVYVDRLILAATNLDETDPLSEDEPQNWVRMAMVNTGGDFDDPDDVGEESSLEEMDEAEMESQVYVATEDIDKTHWMVVQIRTKTSGAGGIAVAVAEPQINYSYQEVPMPYEAPGSMVSDADVEEALSTLDVFVDTASGPYTVDRAVAPIYDLTLTGATTITLAGADPDDGTTLWLWLRPDGNTVTWDPLILWVDGIEPDLTDPLVLISFASVDGGLSWIGDGGVRATELTDLTDVTLTSETEGDTLRYRTGEWVNEALAVPAGLLTVDAGSPTYDDSGEDVVITLATVWGYDGEPYYDSAGAATGEEAILCLDPDTGQLAIVPYQP